MQHAKLAATGLASFFQQVFVGGDFPRGKPDPAIFHAALGAADCQPQQAIHIGDSLIHDIAGARSVGIYSVWLNRKGFDPTGTSHTPNFEIASLAHLAECLKQICNE
jgi:putative hydrolase of the HAD superfamily